MSSEATIAHPQYQYSSLEPGQIRVLELLPGEKAAPIKCRLHHTVLDEKTHYEAVSYVWGQEKHDRPIQIDDCTFLVSPNVEAALHVFRAEVPETGEYTIREETIYNKYFDDSGSRWLWIDAICINQADLEERSHQVRIMGKIYQSSKRLLVWLGVEADGSDDAMEFVKCWGIKTEEGPNARSEWIKGVLASPDIEQLLESLALLVARPWAWRTWILQEFVFGWSDEMLILCGDKKIPYSYLLALIKQDEELADGSVEPWGRNDHMFGMRMCYFKGKLRLIVLNQARTQRYLEVFINGLMGSENITGFRSGQTSPNEVFSLQYWLTINRSSTATDPRDKLFGVLGIIQEYNHASLDLYGFNIDYTASVQDIYSSIVRTIVGAVGTLDILASCSRNTALVSRSWTPDWTAPYQRNYLLDRGYGPGNLIQTIFTSSRNTTFKGDFSSNGNILEATGLIWDFIEMTFTFEQDDENSSSLHETCIDIWKIVKSSTCYGSESEAKKAFWRSLIITPRNSTSNVKMGSTKKDVFTTSDLFIHLSDQGYYDILRHWPALGDPCWSHEDMIHSTEEIEPDERNIVITQKGYIGQALYTGRLQPGDAICVLLGSSVPLVLRPIDGHYVLIGDIYLDGIMHGEAMKALEEGKVQLQKFPIH